MLAFAHSSPRWMHPHLIPLRKHWEPEEGCPILAYPFPQWPSFALARKSSCLHDAYEFMERDHLATVPTFLRSAFGFTLCLIFRRVGGFWVLIMRTRKRQGRGGKGPCRSEKKIYIRKEKETSGASCIYYGGLTTIAVRVADTRGTRGPRDSTFY